VGFEGVTISTAPAVIAPIDAHPCKGGMRLSRRFTGRRECGRRERPWKLLGGLAYPRPGRRRI